MKLVLQTLSLILLVFVISCRKTEIFKPYAKNITIDGIISDTDNNLLDSVEIKLYKSTIMYEKLYVDGKYSKDGIFKFEFTPEDMWNYYLFFQKTGYHSIEYDVNETKSYQKCNMIMEKAEK
jgi:hypothetical protein